MKRILYHISLVCLVLFFISGCVEDKGNYDYHEVVAADIAPFSELETVIQQMSGIEISPQITFSDPAYTDDDFDYLWYTFPITNITNSHGKVRETDTLSFERNLKATLYNAPGKYRLTLLVIDKETGVYSSRTKDIEVINGDAIGYMILSNIDDYAELAFITRSGNIKRNVFEGVNRKKAGKNPIGLHFTQGLMAAQVLWILCEDDDTGGSQFSVIDFSEFQTLRETFFFTPAKMKPQMLSCEGIVMFESIVNDGIAYTRNLRTASGKWDVPMLNDFELDKFIFSNSLTVAFFWDKTNKRFRKLNTLQPSGTQQFIDFQEPAEDAVFDPRNVGMEMLEGYFCGATGMYTLKNNGRAIMKAGNGDIYLLGFGVGRVNSVSNEIIPQQLTNISNHPGIKQAVAYTIKSEGDFAYYGYGNTIGASSFTTGLHLYTYSDLIPSGLTIDCMRVDKTNNMNELWVTANDGTGSATSGSFFIFGIASDGSLTKKAEYLNCCGEVVDILYKNT